jgi:multidrug resistance efflux pump
MNSLPRQRSVRLGWITALAVLSVSAPTRAGDAKAGRSFPGKTQPAPGHVAAICPSVLQPVREVLVAEGDRVKKDAPLVRHDDDEPKAKVKAARSAVAEAEALLRQVKQAPREAAQNEIRQAVEKGRIEAEARKRELDRLEKAFKSGAVPERQVQEARAIFKTALTQQQAAQDKLEYLLKQPVVSKIAEAESKVAAVKSVLHVAEADLEGHTIRARIDGIVVKLTARPGLIERPGEAVWGEILDIRVLDVRCDLPPATLRGLRVGQPAVVTDAATGTRLAGKIARIGVVASGPHGTVPVVVRVANPDERLLCGVDVTVRFEEAALSRRQAP